MASTSRLPTTITRRAIQSLHHDYLRAANSFGMYNFREYFMRVADRKFGEGATSSSSGKSDALGAILGREGLQKLALPKAASFSSSSSTANADTPGEQDVDLLTVLGESEKKALLSWWTQSSADLESWKRSSIVNNLFEAPKLVVEGLANITSPGGGGAGSEAR